MNQSNRNESMKEKVYSVILNRNFTMKTLYMKFAKKYLLSFLIVHLYLIGSATNYYVSNSGNDSNTGLAPDKAWQTLAKVNSVTFKAGDQILFEKGSTFYGTLKVNNSGAAGSPIVYGAYGTGDNPVITGFTTITSGWTNEGGGIYSKNISSESQTNMVTIDGVQYGMGRYPNSGFLSYESSNSNISITDNQLPSTPNWTGAEAVIVKNDWTLDRTLITNQSSNILTYSSLGTTKNASAPGRYFIQNDLKTLDQYGEWYHDVNKSKIYIYIGSTDTSTKIVKIATIDNLVSCGSGSDYITIENLSFVGSIKEAIWIHWQNDNFSIMNCVVNYAGLDGIVLSGATGTITNCNISNCNRVGILSYITNSLITDNTIKNIGTIVGQGNVGLIYQGGIFLYSNNCLVQNNIIENTGYDGIHLSQNVTKALIKNNYIVNTCINLSDQGSIYLDAKKISVKIDGNVIISSNGNGIYLDEYSSNVLVCNNTISNCTIAGIKLHKASSDSITNNTLYNNNTGIQFENWLDENNLYNDVVSFNIFTAKSFYQKTMSFITRYSNFKSSFATLSFSNNYYSRPIDDKLTILTNLPVLGEILNTLSQWRNLSGQDLNSFKSPINITTEDDMRFEYNATSSTKIISINYPMIDIKGKKYNFADTLQPFTSVVLLKDPNPAVSYTEHIAICQGTNYNGWTTTGTYTRTLTAKSGADSIVTTYLTVNPTYAITKDTTIQAGETYNGWTKTGTYTRTLSSVSGCDSTIITNLTVVVAKQGEVLPTHFISVWQNQIAVNPMNIKVVSATKDGLPLAVNDEIALYSGSICVGAVKLTQPIDGTNNSTFVTIPASQNDGSGNGFMANDTIVVKIWDDANHREMVVQNIRYLTDDASWLTTGRYSANATSVIEFKSYTEITQTISLVKGYNMMSTFVSADNPNVSTVTKPLTDSGALVKVQDEYGNSYENWGSYGGWVNNLGGLKATEGYKIKVNSNCSLQVKGRLIALPLTIPLNTGWNIISFPIKSSADAMRIIQPLIDQNKLIKVQDESGNSIEDWGVFGGWVNGIGNFMPGKAYKVKVASNTALTIE